MPRHEGSVLLTGGLGKELAVAGALGWEEGEKEKAGCEEQCGHHSLRGVLHSEGFVDF